MAPLHQPAKAVKQPTPTYVAVTSSGKRCPNQALEGSRYCGIPAHRELAAKEAAGEPVGDGANGQPEDGEGSPSGGVDIPAVDDAADGDGAPVPSEHLLAEGQVVDEETEPKIAGEAGGASA